MLLLSFLIKCERYLFVFPLSLSLSLFLFAYPVLQKQINKQQHIGEWHSLINIFVPKYIETGKKCDIYLSHWDLALKFVFFLFSCSWMNFIIIICMFNPQKMILTFWAKNLNHEWKIHFFFWWYNFVVVVVVAVK